jgi:hypothetical protein
MLAIIDDRTILEEIDGALKKNGWGLLRTDQTKARICRVVLKRARQKNCGLTKQD